jgi:8-oxo-dGTP pyrophosphatase MutT (NUDIX family)
MDTPAPERPVHQEPVQARPTRPRSAASLILLRRGEGSPEVLLGRRGATARFMPGRYVFPGGGVRRDDARPWFGEAIGATGPASLRSAARAALRETYEETGFVVGHPLTNAVRLPAAARTAVEAAYRTASLSPAVGDLVPIGRAITPTFSPIRFDACFFVADGRLAHGPLHPGEELDEVRWYSIAEGFPAPMSSVTQFMLRHAIAVWQGTAPAAMPLYRHIGKATRIDWRPLDGATR